MEQVNSFTGGIDNDSSFNKIANDKYLHLSGGIVVTDRGQTSGAIETERGLKKLFVYPKSPKVYKFNVINTIEDTLIFIAASDGVQVLSSNLFPTGINNTEQLITYINNNLPASFLNLLTVEYSPEYKNIVIKPINSSIGFDVQFSNLAHINLIEIPEQTELVTIGSGTYQNYLILITASLNNPSSNGQIWKIELDISTKKVITSSGFLDFGDFLTYEDHLIYTEKLNLSIEHYITKVICNPEISDITRIYFNDTFNPIRSINIEVPFPMNTPLNFTTGNSLVILKEIVIESVIAGGFIPVGSSVQYYYRLRSIEGGNSTTYSLGSNMFKLVGDLPTDILANDTYKGAAFLDAQNVNDKDLFKSIRVTISDLDTNYTFLELIYVLYEQKSIPNVYKVAEIPIPSNGTISYLHNGDPDDFIALDPTVLNSVNLTINKANDIAVKDQRLIAAGVNTQRGELEFDTRAYRFNNQGISILNSLDSPSILINRNNYSTLQAFHNYLATIPEDFDCVNPYNDETNPTNWLNNHQYKFQSNGSAMGGEGINISYRFVTHTLIAEENVTLDRTSSPFVSSGRFTDGSTINLGNERIYDVSNEYKDFRSPKIDSILKGYAREEIYRIGFQANDLNGNPYYVSWIGDIKMPYEFDSDNLITTNGAGIGLNSQISGKFLVGELNGGTNEAYIYSLGLEFEIRNLDKIRDKVSTYSFVMVKRDAANKTKLGHGLISPMLTKQVNNVLFEPVARKTNTVEHGHSYSKEHYLPGVEEYSHLFYFPYFNTFRSHDEMLYDEVFKHLPGDYINQSSFYNAVESTLVAAQSSPNQYARKMMGYEFMGTYNNTRREVLDSKWKETDMELKVQDFNTLSNFEFLNNLDINPIQNSSLNLLLLYNNGTINRRYVHSKNRIVLLSGPISYGNNNSPSLNNLIMLCSYKRKLNNQYGGQQYFNRQDNIYQSISPNIILGDNNSNKDVVYGGDVCVSYYPIRRQFLAQPDQTSNNITWGSVYWRTNFVTYIFSESALNPYYAHGLNWLLDEFTPDQAATADQGLGYSPLSDFLYNKVYNQINDIKVSSAKPLLTNDNNSLPAGIFVSNKKLNGDRSDSWLVFPVDQFKEVENIYGKITTLLNFKDKLVFIQERAIGIQTIQERAMTFNNENGEQLVLGNGEIVGEHGYISTISGTIHNSSALISEFGLYYYDANLNKIRVLNMENNLPLSDAKGIYSYLNDNFARSNLRKIDKILEGTGVITNIDYEHKRIFFTFKDFILDNRTNETIVYNENLQSFEMNPPYKPHIYISNFKDLLSENPLNRSEVYIHGEGDYNTYYDGIKFPLTLKIVINQPAGYEKVINNILWKSEAFDINGDYLNNVSINEIRVYNNYQDTGFQTDVKKVLRQFSHKVRMNQLSVNKTDRIRNSWCVIELVFNNTNSSRLILHDIITKLNTSYSGLDQI